MKSNSLVNWMGGSLLALSLAILPSALPASAQTTAPTDTTTTTPGTTNTVNTDNTDDGFDWGWLGLLGLIGLAGLKGRDRDTTTTYADRTTTAPASNNPRY